YVATNFAKIPPDEIARNRKGQSSDPKRAAAATFAKALIETRGKVSDAEFHAVRDAGYADGEIVAIIGLTAQYLMTNFMNNAAGTAVGFTQIAAAAPVAG